MLRAGVVDDEKVSWRRDGLLLLGLLLQANVDDAVDGTGLLIAGHLAGKRAGADAHLLVEKGVHRLRGGKALLLVEKGGCRIRDR